MHRLSRDRGRGGGFHAPVDALGPRGPGLRSPPRPGRLLFGIVQGGVYGHLRRESAAVLAGIGFDDGYAVGGLAIGEGQARTFAVLDETVPHLPGAAPRYLMGAGTPSDIIGAVMRGIDLFDCVLPTRSGRTGRAFTGRGTVNIRNARHARDPRPLDADCPCPVCARHARAYLHHLFRTREMLGPILLTTHNLYRYQRLMADLGEAIRSRSLAGFAAAHAAREGGRGRPAPLTATVGVVGWRGIGCEDRSWKRSITGRARTRCARI